MISREQLRFRPGRSAAVCVFAGALFIGAVIVGYRLSRPEFSPTPLSGDSLFHAHSALASGEFERAEQLARDVPIDDPLWIRSRLIAGEAAFRQGRLSLAADYFAEVPRNDSPDAILAVFSLAEVCRELGRLSDAVDSFRWILEHRPDDAQAHERLAFLLGATGQRWESEVHRMTLLRHGVWDLQSLVLLGDLERPMEQGEYLRQCAERTPGDRLVNLGLASDDVLQGRPAEARRRLTAIVDAEPGLRAAQSKLGELLVGGDDHMFLRWHAALPPESETDPDLWYVRGLWARRHNDLKAAARCFWEALRRAPTHRRATYQMGQVLTATGDPGGGVLLERSNQMFELTKALDDVLRSQGRDEDALRRVTGLMERLGRSWEAWAWAATSAELLPLARWPGEALGRVEPQLRPDLPRTVLAADPARQFDLSDFADHRQLFAATRGEQLESADPSSDTNDPSGSIRFEEETDAGIDFVYYNGPDSRTRGVRMFEQNGGGVAVLDYDCDGSPDLYFTQGAEWASDSDTPTFTSQYTDRLFQQRHGVFKDVIGGARIDCREFGQGCAVGDIDDDGFPDLYLANIGRNRLLRNNGDGTFSDATEAARIDGHDWTASCVIVDVNDDGYPDLFDVNYLQGPNIYRIICSGRACSPGMFEGASDRLHISRGNGTFASIPEATPKANSKGMGLVAARLDDSSRPSLMIANDQVANHLLRSHPAPEFPWVTLNDDALVSGVAYNEDGLPMACMGIAADDADGNGLLDFFVTNFKDEANTLYLQDAPGLFVDATTAAGLGAPSWSFVGWGTQFLDVDLDGAPDLVLVNGHVDDYRDEGGEYHMRPQVFRNLGRARFAELTAEQAGEFFARKRLGRGLARLDWNGDGRMDFVVSNIGECASLVTNQSERTGGFVNVRIRARHTARDAIGTLVELAAGDRRWRKQLVAGDGYMASNERVLQFGLAGSDRVDELRVQWPSGAVSRLLRLPVNAAVHLVEGHSRASLRTGARTRLIPVESVPPGASP